MAQNISSESTTPSYSGDIYHLSGRIGIGTSSPLHKLHVEGGDILLRNSSNKSLHLRTDNLNSYISNKDNFVGNGSSGNGNLIFSSQNDFSFRTGSSNSAGTTRMSVKENGEVGIGTSDPTEKLEVYNGRLKISSAASVLHFRELDNNKNWFAIADGNHFRIAQNTTHSDNTAFYIRDNSNVGIGLFPSHKLDVNGTIHAKEVLVDLNFPGPDYVFEEDYNLTSLEELHDYLKENKHLPEVPSAAQMQEEGINVVEMDMLLLKKVEELTLHIIAQQKEIEKLKRQIKNTN